MLIGPPLRSSGLRRIAQQIVYTEAPKEAPIKPVPAILLALGACAAFGQPAAPPPAFEIASVKPSNSIVGHDGEISTDPKRFSARNATLKRLTFEAYRIPYSQITGGPAWLDSNEFDIDARTPSPASADQLKLMLRTLLADRFKLAAHSQFREGRVYALLVAKNGPRLHDGSGNWRFHGEMSQFAAQLAMQLTIPLLDDPKTPSHARGAPIPVVNKTGIEGIYDIRLDIKPDASSDAFTVWQRALQEQLGLKLESQKAPIEFLIIDHAEKVPTQN